MAFPMVNFPVVHHTWVLVSRGSSGYTRKAISQDKTNVTQMCLCNFPRPQNPWVLLLYPDFPILHSSYSPVIGFALQIFAELCQSTQEIHP